MDIEQQHGPDDQDAAERAFELLRDEVAALRRDIELVYRQQQAGAAGQGSAEIPDYSPTLGAMAQELRAINARLDGIEAQPALATTPARQATELRRELHQIGQDARYGLAHSQAELDGSVRELRGLIGVVRSRKDQRDWLCAAGALGVMGGVLLWFLLTATLPWGAGTWLAGLAYGGRWQAGQLLMRDADPVSWDRMVRLYRACPQDSTTETCEAAMAVRPAAPSPSHPSAKATR